MNHKHEKRSVVVILASGESVAPKQIRCVSITCGRMMFKVNRDVDLILEDNQGVHWADVPDDVTVVEHKCRGCDFYYRFYTPKTVIAKNELDSMIKRPGVV